MLRKKLLPIRVVGCPSESPSLRVFRSVRTRRCGFGGCGDTAAALGARLDWLILKVASNLADSMRNKRPGKRNKGEN